MKFWTAEESFKLSAEENEKQKKWKVCIKAKVMESVDNWHLLADNSFSIVINF